MKLNSPNLDVNVLGVTAF